MCMEGMVWFEWVRGGRCEWVRGGETRERKGREGGGCGEGVSEMGDGDVIAWVDELGVMEGGKERERTEMGSGDGEGRVGWEGECGMEEGEREEGWCHLSVHSLRNMWGVLGFIGLLVQRLVGLWAYGLMGVQVETYGHGLR